MGNYTLNIICSVILFCFFVFFLKDRITRFCVKKLPTYIYQLEKIPNSANELCINVIFYEDFVSEAYKYWIKFESHRYLKLIGKSAYKTVPKLYRWNNQYFYICNLFETKHISVLLLSFHLFPIIFNALVTLRRAIHFGRNVDNSFF